MTVFPPFPLAFLFLLLYLRFLVCCFMCARCFRVRVQPVDPNNTTVFVGNLVSGDVPAGQLESIFGVIGPIAQVRICTAKKVTDW